MNRNWRLNLMWFEYAAVCSLSSVWAWCIHGRLVETIDIQVGDWLHYGSLYLSHFPQRHC